MTIREPSNARMTKLVRLPPGYEWRTRQRRCVTRSGRSSTSGVVRTRIRSKSMWSAGMLNRVCIDSYLMNLARKVSVAVFIPKYFRVQLPALLTHVVITT